MTKHTPQGGICKYCGIPTSRDYITRCHNCFQRERLEKAQAKNPNYRGRDSRCFDCGSVLAGTETKRCQTCYKEYRKQCPQKQLSRPTKKFYCECGKEKTRYAKRCIGCHKKQNKNVNKCKYCKKILKNIYATQCLTCYHEHQKKHKDISNGVCECGATILKTNKMCRKCYLKKITKHDGICKNCGETMSKYNKQTPYCRKCVSGSRHPNWNPQLSNKDRQERGHFSGLKQWRLAVYSRDDYTCQSCGDHTSGKLVAHHLDSWDIHQDKRFDVSNGITLCRKCHNGFHHKCGYGQNTVSQFYEWINDKNSN